MWYIVLVFVTGVSESIGLSNVQCGQLVKEKLDQSNQR